MDIVKLLIDGGTNSSNQIAQIETDLCSYQVANLPSPAMSFDRFKKQLAKNVANFNAVDLHGNTAMHHAFRQGLLCLAYFLYDHGVNINHLNNDGNSSLLIAVLEGFCSTEENRNLNSLNQ